MKICIATVLFFPLGLMAQEEFGAAFSNYTPTTSVFLNPSSMLDVKTWLDIHIAGAGTYLNNNFVSLKDDNLGHIACTQGRNITEESVEYHQGKRRYHAYNRTFTRVLSGVWSQGDHAAGLFFNVRSFTAARGIPSFAARFIEYGIPPYTVQHNIDYNLKRIRAASVNFGEIQLSYAQTFYKRHRNMLMGGVSVKKFISVAGGAFNLYNADFNVRSDTLLAIFSLEADAMYTSEPQIYRKGGMGMDIGFTYQKMLADCSSYYPNSKKNGCRYLPYKYKIGVSILDIGSVKFKEESRQYAGYDFQSFEWQKYADIDVNENNALEIFATEESSIDEGRVKKTTKIRLPTCISVQGDYNLWGSYLYANAAIFQGLPLTKSRFGVRRANSLMAGVRFESKYFDISLPLSLYEYKTPQVGLAVRLYFLTIGTDKLLHWIGRNDLYGGDIYVQIKVPIFYHPKCKAHRKSGLNYDPSKIRRRKDNCDAYN